MKIKKISADGNCFFNSILSLEYINSQFLDVIDFRYQLYDYMFLNEHKYKNYYNGNYLIDILNIKIDKCWCLDIFDIVPIATSDMLELQIEIIDDENIVIVIGEEYENKISLLYNKEFSHYDVISEDKETEEDDKQQEEYDEYTFYKNLKLF